MIFADVTLIIIDYRIRVNQDSSKSLRKEVELENLDIRILVAENHIRYKDIAKKLGISAVWLSTQMRHKLSPVKRQQIKKAIMELKDDTRDSGTVSGI